jgi:hypothetical protein
MFYCCKALVGIILEILSKMFINCTAGNKSAVEMFDEAEAHCFTRF